MAAKRMVREMMPCINILQVTETKEDLVPVAAYARVSTEKEEQEDSFERQVEHYTQMISENPKWRMVEVYADPGISGTRAEKRPNFMRMIQDCREGKIKRILVKSISTDLGRYLFGICTVFVRNEPRLGAVFRA